MRQTITISLPKDLKKALEEAVREQGISRSDLLRQSLRDYLFLRRFRSLRQKLLGQTGQILTDDEVFQKVS